MHMQECNLFIDRADETLRIRECDDALKFNSIG